MTGIPVSLFRIRNPQGVGKWRYIESREEVENIIIYSYSANREAAPYIEVQQVINGMWYDLNINLIVTMEPEDIHGTV